MGFFSVITSAGILHILLMTDFTEVIFVRDGRVAVATPTVPCFVFTIEASSEGETGEGFKGQPMTSSVARTASTPGSPPHWFFIREWEM